jgi:hypothetical protein
MGLLPCVAIDLFGCARKLVSGGICASEMLSCRIVDPAFSFVFVLVSLLVKNVHHRVMAFLFGSVGVTFGLELSYCV